MSDARIEYGDIIDLPHHQSNKRPHMSQHDRAAQFAPFAALRGYDEEIAETARLTDKKNELSSDDISLINERLHIIKYIKALFDEPLDYFGDKAHCGFSLQDGGNKEHYH